MAFIPLPNGFKVALEYIKNGQLVVNIYHVISDAPAASVNLTVLMQVFYTWWVNNGRPNATTSISLRNIVVTDVSVEDGRQYTRTLDAGDQAGNRNILEAPNNVAMVVSFGTGRSGRSFRGRTYLAWLAASDVAADAISGTLAAALTAAYTSLDTQLATAGFSFSVASYVLNGAPRITAIGTPINAISTSLRIDTQRRRLPDTGT